MLTHGIPLRPSAATHPRLRILWEELAARRPRFIEPNWHQVERFRSSEVRELGSIFDTKPQDVRDFVLSDWRRILDVGNRFGTIILPETSTNWCGAYVRRPITGIASNRPHLEPFRVVAGRWVVPSVSLPPSAFFAGLPREGSYRCSVWVGIDGTAGSNDVLQAGTEGIVNVSGGKITGTTYRAWIEWFSLASIPESLTVSPGDLISVTVCAPMLGGANGSAVIANLTTNEIVTYRIEPPAGPGLVGNVAEWIVEDPGQLGGGLFPLANFGQVVFTDCSAGSQDIERNVDDATFIDLVDASGVARAESHYLSSSSLRCQFVK